VGIFVVNDTNLRLLLAGIAIIANENFENIFKVFDFFINIHGKPPSSIITDDQNAIHLAIEELRFNEFFTGSHMLDPWHVLKNVKEKLKGADGTNQIVQKIAEAIM